MTEEEKTKLGNWMRKMAHIVTEQQKAIEILKKEKDTLYDKIEGLETILTKNGVSTDALDVHQAFKHVGDKHVAQIEYEN